MRRKEQSEDEYLESLRADIRVLRFARERLKGEDKSPRTERALEALDRKLREKLIELTQLRGYVPRLEVPSVAA